MALVVRKATGRRAGHRLWEVADTSDIKIKDGTIDLIRYCGTKKNCERYLKCITENPDSYEFTEE